MNVARDLNEREQQILQAVVHMYVTEAEPVGSRSIVKRLALGLSPATVRNVMADLEELGYLEQVHTSSGRIPTEVGYRYYVSHLMQVQQLTLTDRERIEGEFSQRLNDADQVLRQTTQLLALISQQAGIAEAPSQAIATLQRLDLMQLAPDRLVLLTADNFGRVKTMTVALAEAIMPEMLQVPNAFLNQHLRGVQVDHLAAEVEARLRTFYEQRRIAELALRVLNLVPAQRGGTLFLEGASQLHRRAGTGVAAVSLAVDVDVVPADARHLRPIEVIGWWITQLQAGLDEGWRQRMMRVLAGVDHAHGAAMARPGAGGVLLVLHLFEVGQHLLVAPARAAVVLPVIVVPRMPANMHHDVQAAGAADHLAARACSTVAVQARLRS